MSRLRFVMLAVVLGTGVVGCYSSHWSIYHCDDCDDFPMPAQSMANDMMPGTYTGPPAQDSPSAVITPPAGTAAPAGTLPPIPASPLAASAPASSPPAMPAMPR